MNDIKSPGSSMSGSEQGSVSSRGSRGSGRPALPPSGYAQSPAVSRPRPARFSRSIA